MALKENVVAAMAEIDAEASAQLDQEAQGHTRVNPLPEDGTYDVALFDIDAFTTEVKSEQSAYHGKTVLNAKLSFKAIGGPIDGQIIEKPFWGSSAYDRAAFLDFVTVLAGTKCGTVNEGLIALDGKEGTTARIRVSTNTIKKGARKGQQVRNVDIVQ